MFVIMNWQVITIILSVILLACNTHNEPISMNKLNKSASPYLQQHADNPVHWHEWGQEALEMAKKQNKPLIISIGYAACHWCHVMEHESFSDEEVASYMNENFICIKVDREERPDIDQIYMDAVHLISGQGGWPLNAFALPDGRPFYAGTYFPKKKWLDVMKQIISLYKNEYSKVDEYANELMSGINKTLIAEVDTSGEISFSDKDYLELKTQWLKNTDFQDGGFNRAPKFPMPVAWEFLLEYYYQTQDNETLEAVTLTLDKMASGGIYDQIGGGFARYSVDSYWKVPHFEKMLYDNGQLVSLYAHAYQITGKSRYRDIIDQTLGFVKRELTDENGGFYSSLNADSEGMEGKFYIWMYDEFMKTLENHNPELMARYYQVVPHGNWDEGTNILYTQNSANEFALENKIEDFNTTLQKANLKLLNKRGERIRPSTDDKILTSWNALMITGYLDAYIALGNEEYLTMALSASEFIRDNMEKPDGGLFRSHMNGKSGIDAFLDDYALLADAYIKLYSVTFDFQWLFKSQKLIEYCIEHFYDEKTGMFFYTSDLGEELITRKHEMSDNVIPASNSVIAKLLFKAGHIFSNEQYIEKSEKMLQIQIDKISKSGIWYANWASLSGMQTIGISELAIVGKSSKNNSLELQKSYLPFTVIVSGKEELIPLLEGRVNDENDLIYVCRNRVCDLPSDKVSAAMKTINSHRIRSL